MIGRPPSPGTTAAVKKTLEHISKLPPEEVIPYLATVVQLGLDLLRGGGKYDEHVREMLDASIERLKTPALLRLDVVREKP